MKWSIASPSDSFKRQSEMMLCLKVAQAAKHVPRQAGSSLQLAIQRWECAVR